VAWRSRKEGWNEAVEGRKESIGSREMPLKAGMNVTKKYRNGK
jgi:hypothetical protein